MHQEIEPATLGLLVQCMLYELSYLVVRQVANSQLNLDASISVH